MTGHTTHPGYDLRNVESIPTYTTILARESGEAGGTHLYRGYAVRGRMKRMWGLSR
jgi:hypothetical protein